MIAEANDKAGWQHRRAEGRFKEMNEPLDE